MLTRLIGEKEDCPQQPGGCLGSLWKRSSGSRLTSATLSILGEVNRETAWDLEHLRVDSGGEGDQPKAGSALWFFCDEAIEIGDPEPSLVMPSGGSTCTRTRP